MIKKFERFKWCLRVCPWGQNSLGLRRDWLTSFSDQKRISARNMKLFSATVILCSLLVTLHAQQRRSSGAKSEFRLRKDVPTVYITFERAGKRKPLEQGESEQRIWLRLHNNARWRLRLAMNGVPKEYGEAALFYDVLSEGKVVVERRCHVCSSNQLRPGRSLLFSLPREDLVKGGAIRVKFSYGWEHPDDVFADREPQHFVYFYSSKLPPQLQTRLHWRTFMLARE